MTAALDATDGNIRKVQKLSRHADPRTLMIYDDNRNNIKTDINFLCASVWMSFITMLEYASPPIWLNAHIQDPRIKVGDYTYFDRHISLAIFTPSDRIEIGKFCSLARDIVIFGGGNHIMTRVTTFPFKWLSAEASPEERYTDASAKGATIIGHDVWVGHGATILSGVKIGNGAVVGAQAVVASDVPAYAIVVGNPAKIIRYRFEPKTVERLLELSWWDWESQKIAANLDLLYTNPDEWLPEIQLKQPQADVLKLIGMPSAEHPTDRY